jgi:hypothetical protein
MLFSNKWGKTLCLLLLSGSTLTNAATLSEQQWRYGWTTLDAAGVLGAWHGAQQPDKDKGDIRRYRADGFKAAVGIADLYVLNPAPAELSAKQAWQLEAYHWQAHVPTLAFNLALSAYVNHGGHRGEAEAFLISGIISGELYLWSKTWISEGMSFAVRDRQLVVNWQF